MDKTLHKKLTGKYQKEGTRALVYANGDCLPSVFMQEMNLLQEAARDLLQPRPEAVALLLRLAKTI